MSFGSLAIPINLGPIALRLPITRDLLLSSYELEQSSVEKYSTRSKMHYKSNRDNGNLQGGKCKKIATKMKRNVTKFSSMIK